MAVPGNFSEKQQYLTKISEPDFVYLVRDILVLHFNHRDAKIVDGPGDGKRDIYSLDARYNECITQCKFHHDFNQTSGTRETDEIIIALNKFGYSSGFFCTSGKISPQSKREYLDNYPGFELKWLEGVDIVDIVLGNSLLKKIWFDGNKIHLSTTAIALPFVIRKLPADKEIKLEAYIQLSTITVEATVAEASYPFKQFTSFRDMGIRSHGHSNGLAAGYHLILSGKVTFNEIAHLKNLLLSELKKHLPEEYQDSYYAVRFGIPYFIGQDEKKYTWKLSTKFNLPISSETFIISDNEIILESDWLVETDNDWNQPDRIHMSQLSYFGFYNNELDVIHFIYYSCQPEYENNLNTARLYEVDKILWRKSLFFEGESAEIERFLDNISEFLPHKLFDYGPAGKLACWLHPEPMVYATDLDLFENNLLHPAFEAEKQKIRALSASFNINEIGWNKASKVAAINDDDPFPEEKITTFSIVELYESFESVPSPIQPMDRQIPFECVWCLGMEDELSEIEAKIDLLLEDLKEVHPDINLEFDLDDETSDKSIYLCIYYKTNSKPFLSTKKNVNEQTTKVTECFNKIEKNLLKTFPKAKRSTGKYWYKEFGVILNKVL